MAILYIVTFFASLIFVVTLTPMVKAFALKWHIVDNPNERKIHTKVMPRLGGLAIYLASVATVSIVFALHGASMATRDVQLLYAFLTGGSLIVLIGMLDDRFELSAKRKLVGQIAAACVVVFGFEIRLDELNIPFYTANVPLQEWIAIPLTILWVVGVTNAVNLIDGLDGLAAGVSAIAIGTIAIIASLLDNRVIVLLCLALLGSIIGFLFFNFHPARIFMGDSGSLFLGFSLAMLSMLGFKQVALVSFITPLLIIGVPLSDTLFAIVRRALDKKPIFSPDRGHLHHCLRELGFSHRKTVLLIYGISLFFGMLAVIQATATMNEATGVTIFVVCTLVFLLQIGAEGIGLIGKTKRPLLNLLGRRRVKFPPPTEPESDI